MGPLVALMDDSNSATKAIWDHIKTYSEPVVVVVDSNKQNSDGTVPLSSYSPSIASINAPRPTLHYIVVMGIKEQTAGGARRFFVYDPADINNRPLEYSEEDLRTLMELPRSTWPEWVYQYGISQVNYYPAYILKVQGK